LNVKWYTESKLLIGVTAPVLASDNAGTFVYYVANHSEENCQSEMVKITSIINQNPYAVARKQDVSCLGGSDGKVQLEVKGGQFPYRFNWNNGDHEKDLINVSSGTYSAMVTDLRGCNARTTNVVVNDGVNPPPPEARSLELCAGGGTVGLTAKGANLQWYTYDGVPLSSAPYIDKRTPASYAYYVSSRSTLGCESEKSFVSALVRSAPTITTINKKEPDCNGYEKGYFDVIADGGCNNSMYTYKLLNTMQEQTNGIFNNISPGTYHVQVSDECGCATTQDVEIGITMTDCDLLMPTAFTPNNDSNNDWFRPASYGGISGYKMQIYNRWGQLLYQTEAPNDGWDGRYKAKDQPPATYVYQLSYKNSKGEFKYQKGTVVLLR
jgi:gliding motility-associated-like protein